MRHTDRVEHYSGDFFSDAYLAGWLRIIRARPTVNFYAYTKEVARFRSMVEPDPPENFLWVYSFGGTQDADLDVERDRVADVFPDEDAIAAAGWHSQEASDLLAVLGPRLVGIPANRIPHYLKRLAGRTFRSWQAEVDAERAAHRTHAPRRSHLTLLPGGQTPQPAPTSSRAASHRGDQAAETSGFPARRKRPSPAVSPTSLDEGAPL